MMERIRVLAAILVVGLALACNFTEEIHFNEDGSGKLNIHFNGNEMMEMLASMDSSSTPEKSIDSTLVFKELLEKKKDSIAQLPIEEQEKLKKLEPFSIRMIFDEEKGKMNFDMFSDFKSVEEVNNAFNAFQEAGQFGPSPGTNSSAPMKNSSSNTEVNYTFDGNSFSRTISIVDKDVFEKGLDSLQGAEMFLSGSTYTFKYHFQRRVKKVNVEGATFSMDGKTMIYEVNFMDMMKKPESINLQVELEN